MKRLGVAIAAVIGFGALGACDREARSFRQPPQLAATPEGPRISDLQAGGRTEDVAPPTSATANASDIRQAVRASPYEDNAYAVSEGKRLFSWYNCVGCHGHGGGGMGPPLMDDKWLYGSRPEDIFATIVGGRPNGMPSFRGRISEQQVWQLVAYVRSMSGLLRGDVLPSRSDELQSGEPEVARDRETPRPDRSKAKQP
jgi:cytochrome c oxidase cbb3-type subunit 3